MDDFDIPAAEDMMNEEMDLPDEGPILKVGEEKEIGKQGLKKKLVKEGEGWDYPETGDEVEGINKLYYKQWSEIRKIKLKKQKFFRFENILDSDWLLLVQFIIRGRCWMELSSTRAVIEGLLSSSLSVKVNEDPLFLF